jgi:hypothetical protein
MRGLFSQEGVEGLDLSTNKKEVIVFRHDLAPGAKVTLSERVKGKGTIESVRVRFYKGQQLALEVNPYAKHTRNRKEDLLTYASNGGKKVLAGDDDQNEYPSVVTVDIDDEVCVDAYNSDATYTYTVAVDVVIDYYAGNNRVV